MDSFAASDLCDWPIDSSVFAQPCSVQACSIPDVNPIWQYVTAPWGTSLDFDDALTAPLHGFDDAAQYYATSSSEQFIPKIRVPTLIVHAVDDPLMPPDIAPDASMIPPNVRVELSDTGGHVGFVHGTPWKPRYWLDERIRNYLQRHFESIQAP